MRTAIQHASPRAVLTGVSVASVLPILLVIAFPAQLNRVLEPASYVVFHNVAEFFSIMVSLSIFGVGWYTYNQSRNTHALFLGAAFLGIGLMDFMHTMSNAAMPAFITPNSSNKSTQYWIAVRLFQAVSLLASALIYPETQSRWLSKRVLLTSVLAVSGLVFAGVTYFPGYVPDTFVSGSGLTAFKKNSEYLVTLLLCVAVVAYRRRMTKTGNKELVYYQAAFTISIFSEVVFAIYTRAFDTYNVLGHVYKVAAFAAIYKGIFIASVTGPYVKLAEMMVSRDELSREVTERKRAELALLRRSEELEAVNRELESFVYSISHDLRAPARTMAGFAKILIEDYANKIDDQGRDYLSRIQTNAGKMTRLIEDLLKLSRITRQELDRIETDLSARASAVITELRESGPGENAEITIQQGLKASADPRLVEVVLSNLFGNALKFSAKTADARIEFGACDDGNGSKRADELMKRGKTVYYVKDNGAGFDPAYAEKMFWPFQRLHTDQEFEGTGIGLTIVERIIHRHGGKVWAEGMPGKGATIYFTL